MNGFDIRRCCIVSIKTPCTMYMNHNNFCRCLQHFFLPNKISNTTNSTPRRSPSYFLSTLLINLFFIFLPTKVHPTGFSSISSQASLPFSSCHRTTTNSILNFGYNELHIFYSTSFYLQNSSLRINYFILVLHII